MHTCYFERWCLRSVIISLCSSHRETHFPMHSPTHSVLFLELQTWLYHRPISWYFEKNNLWYSKLTFSLLRSYPFVRQLLADFLTSFSFPKADKLVNDGEVESKALLQPGTFMVMLVKLSHFQMFPWEIIMPSHFHLSFKYLGKPS